MPILYFPKGPNAKKMARQHQKGELHRIRKGIYIDTHDSEEIARTLESKWIDIACHLFKDPVAVARTAAELKPAEGRLYLVSSNLSGRRTVPVGHLRLDIGPGITDQGVEPFIPDMKRSNQARMCLENLSASRGSIKNKKTLGQQWVEAELVKIVGRRGELALNTIRDEARELAPALKLEKEFEKLTKIISAILKTHPLEGILQSRLGIAQAKGEPFDQPRVDLLRAFAKYLQPLNLSANPYTYNKSNWHHLSFFESYFSNYIEGTEFTIEEAEEIVFQGKTIDRRHKDSHDVLAHMEISSDMAEMNKLPSTAEELIDILKVRHKLLLAERPDKRPGSFKEKINKAGGTVFVLPEHVEGTLVQGFEIYQSLSAGMNRAIFIHFLISECHPFDDGNGRLSRIMMNAELVSEDEFKILVPTVHRDSCLNGLRKVSRDHRFRITVKVMHQLQCYAALLDWTDYGEVKSTLQKHAADKEPDEGVTIFNKAISALGDTYPPG